MPGDLPHYFSQLAPFAPLFETGRPVLTYHKFGPRPRGVRLKGLYLGTALFDRQLTELRVAGWKSGSLETPGDPRVKGTPVRREIVLTIDDGFRSVHEHALAILRRRDFRAILFLVADRLGRQNDWEVAEGEAMAPLMNETEVREWLAAGHVIGSHTLSHPRLTRVAPAAAREEIVASRCRLEDRFGVPVRHFCYPYGDWNSAVRGWVEEAGYATACTTDFGVNAPGQDRMALRRITARYPSRGGRVVRGWWRRLWGRT